MKIRITDLLDEYLDDDLPLDAMPDILPGDRPKQKPNRAAHRPSHRKRAGQIVAAVLIVASISVAGGLKLWCGGAAGKSLASTAAEPAAQEAAAEAAEPATEPETVAEYVEEDTPLTDGGYYSSTISVEGDAVDVSVGDVTRDGSTYQMKVIIDTPTENVTGFLLEDYDAYLILADGTVALLSTSVESAYPENPFMKEETFTFDESISEGELKSAVFYLQIHSITLTTTDATATYVGAWDVSFSETGITVTTEIGQEQSQEETQTIPENQVFSITDLNVSAMGCTFWLHTTADQFTLVPQGQLALAAEQDRDAIYYGFSLLTDAAAADVTITLDSTTMSTRGVTDTQNLVYCTVTWKESIEPTSITGLYFTDGTVGQTVDVNAYVY